LDERETTGATWQRQEGGRENAFEKMSVNLNPEKALIFRIQHVDNVPWNLDHDGLHCRNSPTHNPNYVNIGNPDLIDKRSRHPVPIPPGGTLSDYVPFYFTPFSVMMYNIYTGYGGIKKRENREIVIFVSSIHRLIELQIPFVFTNQHAYAAGTDYFSDSGDLDQIDWPLLRSRNFKTDDDDPGKGLRYQAEALVHQHLPLAALLGICCNDDTVKQHLDHLLAARGQQIVVKATPIWYF
jgi:ssDNA thymidine ADP-ribosyltransferase, DarT